MVSPVGVMYRLREMVVESGESLICIGSDRCVVSPVGFMCRVEEKKFGPKARKKKTVPKSDISRKTVPNGV